MIAGSLEIRLFAELARLSKDMNDAKTVVGGAMKNIEGAVSMAKTALGALGIGIGVLSFVNMVRGTIDAAERLRDLSAATDIAVDDLAGLKLLAKQTGTDLDGLAKGINKMSVAMGKEPEAFKALGVTAKDNVGAFKQLADIFNLLPDIQQRNALAMKVFGKSWAELAPAFKEGSAGIQTAMDKGKALSGMTKEFADAADKFKDKWAEVDTSMDGVKVRMVGQMLPAMQNIADSMAEASKQGGVLMGVWVMMGGTAHTIWTEIVRLYDHVFGTDRLTEIAKQLQDAKLRLQSGTTMPEGAGGGFWSFSWLIPDIKLGEKNLEHIRELVKSLEAEKAKLLAGQSSSFNFDKAYEEQLKRQRAAGFRSQAEIDTSAKAKAFLNDEKDLDSTYRSMLKTLQEKLLVETELNEVKRLQIALDALSAKQRATISPEEEAHLKRLAAELDVRNNLKKIADLQAKADAARQAESKERTEALAADQKVRDDALMAGYKNLEQMEFEIKLIGKTNEEREVAIAMRALETSAIDKQSESYGKLRERMKTAILSKSAAEEAQKSQVSMWQSIESAGHQAFLSIFDSSKSVLERIKDMLKTHILDVLYQMTIKKWIINIATSVSGAGVSQAAFGSGGGILDSLFGSSGGGGGGGGIGNLLSLGSSAYTAATGNSLLGTIGSALGFGTAAASMATVNASAAAIMGGATGAATAGVAAGAVTAASAIPYVGAAIAAAYALGLFDEGGGPKASDVGLQGTPGNVWFGQNNVTDSAWGEQYALQFYKDYKSLSKGAQSEFIDPLIGTSVVGTGPDSAANLSRAYQEAMRQALAFDGTIKQLILSFKISKDPLAYWTAEIAKFGAKLKKPEIDTMEEWREAFEKALNSRKLTSTQLSYWQSLGKAIEEATNLVEAETLAKEAEALATKQAAEAALQAAAAEKQLLEQRRDSAEDALRTAMGGLSGKLGVDTLLQAQASLAVSESLSPLDRIAAQKQLLQDAFAKAMAGDLNAVPMFAQELQATLSLGREVFASGSEFQTMFVDGNRQLNELLAQQQGIQTDIMSSIPLTVQEAGQNTVAALRAGFAEMVTELQSVRVELRRVSGEN